MPAAAGRFPGLIVPGRAVAPGLSEFVLNQAFRLFPDSAAARGAGDAEGEPAPRSPADLARKLFAQVFSGVHW